MAGFSSYDDLIAEMTTNGKTASWEFVKTSTAPEAAGVWHSLWRATGAPGQGASVPTTPGTVYDDAAGSIQFPATTPDQKHIVTFGAAASVACTLMVYDRLVAASESIATTGDKTYNTGALSRYTSGLGVFPFAEYNVASTAAGQYSLSSYTNQSGTTGRSGPVVTPPAAAMNIDSMLWLPIHAEDKGVRSVETLNVAVAASGATLNVVLCKPLAYLPLPANTWVERDMVLQLSAMPRVYDTGSLGLAILATATTAVTVWGQIRIAYG